MSSSLQQKYSDIISKFNDYLLESKDYRRVWEIRSFVDESFYEGNHRVVFDTITKQITTLPLKSDNQYTIGKVRKIVRGVRNMITKNDPRWHPNSSRIQSITQEEKEVASAILNGVYKEDHIKDKIKDLLTHSLTKTLAWAFVGYDNRKKDVDIFIEDPFNIYTSPEGRLEGPVFVGKYIIRTVRKSLDDIKNNSIYKNGKFKTDLKSIQGDNKLAESEYKQDILNQDYTIPVDKNGGAILQELYIMEKVKHKQFKLEDNTSSEEDQLIHEKEDTKVRIITKVGDIIIRDELTDYNQFPFVAYQPERNKGLLYHTSWINPTIQLNKALDEGYSNRADWIEKFAKGRYLVQKGSKFSIIKGRNGQIAEYTGSKPEILQTGNLPNEVNVHLSETERYMEDLGGIHSESTGRLTGSELSGVAIAQLQASDQNNVSEPVDNLKSFMEELAYRILDMASKFYNLRSIDTEKGKKRIIGSEVKQNIEDITEGKLGKDIVSIKPIKNIEVEIVPGSAFSDLQARQDLVELRGLGVQIPDSLIINTYKLGNSQTILNEYEREQQQKEEMEDGAEGLESKQAELENQKMLEGANIVAQQDENHEIHLAIHGSLLEQARQDPKSQIISQHMLQHEGLMNQGMQSTQPEAQQMQQQIQPGAENTQQNIGQPV